MRGHIDSYLMNNKPSFIVSEVDVYFEEGDFYKEKLIIENRLKEQGILDNNKKLPMPFLPLRLAVFSNESSAGWGDFIKKIYESMFPFEITIFQTALQGKELEPAMMKAFEMLEKYGTDKFDVGVILRGGGATKDLYDFNNYRIAEYIAPDGREELPPHRFMDWPNLANAEATHAGLQGLLRLGYLRGEALMEALGDPETASFCREKAALL